MLNNDTETTIRIKEPHSESSLISDKQAGMGKRVFFIVILIIMMLRPRIAAADTNGMGPPGFEPGTSRL